MAREILQIHPNMSNPAEPSPEEKLEQVERVLRSRVFQGSGIVMTMLEYLARQSVDDPDSQVKEYTVALEVFGRGSEFDPRTNSIVRVQAKRLRNKLREYYETEGKSDRVLIDLPKGHYKVTFSFIEAKDETAFVQDDESETSLPPLSARPGVESQSRVPKTDVTKAVLTAVIVILSVIVLLMALPFFNTVKHPQPAGPPNEETDYGVLWAPFLKGNESVLIVLSNPPIYRFLNNSDSEAALKESVQLSPEQEQKVARTLKDKLVMKQGGTPRLVLSTSSYTGMGEAVGLFHLTDMVRSAGKELTLKQSRTVSAEDFKNHNVILLGSAWVNVWVEKLPVKEDFIYSVKASIENRDPLPGEEREYKPRFDEQTGEVKQDYALITVKPGLTSERRLMILAGLLSEGTQAAAEYVTRKEYLKEINRRLEQLAGEEGPLKYYQALLRVDVDNGIPTTVSLLAVHPLEVKSN